MLAFSQKWIAHFWQITMTDIFIWEKKKLGHQVLWNEYQTQSQNQMQIQPTFNMHFFFRSKMIRRNEKKKKMTKLCSSVKFLFISIVFEEVDNISSSLSSRQEIIQFFEVFNTHSVCLARFMRPKWLLPSTEAWKLTKFLKLCKKCLFVNANDEEISKFSSFVCAHCRN